MNKRLIINNEEDMYYAQKYGKVILWTTSVVLFICII